MHQHSLLILLVIGILLYGTAFSIAYGQTTVTCVNGIILHIIELHKILQCYEDRITDLENNPPSGADQTTASNLGTIGEGIFAQEIGNDLQFKKLVSGTGITLQSNLTRIMINSTGGGGDTTNCNNVGTGQPIHVVGSNCNARSLIAGTGITITDTTDDYTVASTVVGYKQIGQSVGEIYQSLTKTNIGITDVDIYVSAFDEENKMIIDFNNATYFRIIYQWDYVGTGTHTLSWKDVSNNSNVLATVGSITADRDAGDTGWLSIPSAFINQVKTIEWQGRSTVGTDDPVAKGYKIMIK